MTDFEFKCEYYAQARELLERHRSNSLFGTPNLGNAAKEVLGARYENSDKSLQMVMKLCETERECYLIYLIGLRLRSLLRCGSDIYNGFTSDWRKQFIAQLESISTPPV